ncbi:MAG: outer-membrane lipoprotein carrier protein LolA [Clostridia bacterium]|nr:outer-membrane lipoprotein carrier protein LolA [Clostridia bacterium]
MRYKSWSIIILMIVLLTGCVEKTDEEIFYRAQKKIVSLDTYRAKAKIRVYGNKAPEEYFVQQWFKAPDKYRTEVEEPEDVKGKITIYNGKKAWICQPRIGQEWLMEDFSNSVEQKMFLGYFIDNFLNTENPRLTRETFEDEDYILIETDIPGNHPYFNKKRLWFDIKKYYPHKLEVLDKDDNIRIDVKYVDFIYNEDIDDEIFTIKGNL